LREQSALRYDTRWVSLNGKREEWMANNSDRQPIFAGFPDNLKGESLGQMMQLLVDRELIRDLTAAYAHRVAHGLANADLFTDDGAYIHRRSPDEEAHEVRGREALDAHYVARPESRGVATPMIHNHLIEVEGDHARAICSIELRIAAGEGVFASGYYEDVLHREDGQWKFFERRVTFFRWGEESASS
jgi:hypothetical protein